MIKVGNYDGLDNDALRALRYILLRDSEYGGGHDMLFFETLGEMLTELERGGGIPVMRFVLGVESVG